MSNQYPKEDIFTFADMHVTTEM